MVEIHTHVAAASHLWVKEASREQRRDGGTEGDIHTHNPYKVHKKLLRVLFIQDIPHHEKWKLGLQYKRWMGPTWEAQQQQQQQQD